MTWVGTLHQVKDPLVFALSMLLLHLQDQQLTSVLPPSDFSNILQRLSAHFPRYLDLDRSPRLSPLPLEMNITKSFTLVFDLFLCAFPFIFISRTGTSMDSFYGFKRRSFSSLSDNPLVFLRLWYIHALGFVGMGDLITRDQVPVIYPCQHWEEHNGFARSSARQISLVPDRSINSLS